MHVRATVLGSAAATAVIIGLVSGCGVASFTERMTYLEKVANEGVQTHRLIVGEGSKTDEKRCTDAFNGLNDWDAAPSDDGIGGHTADWLNQIQAFFVQSCVTGLPKPVPGQLGNTPSLSASATH